MGEPQLGVHQKKVGGLVGTNQPTVQPSNHQPTRKKRKANWILIKFMKVLNPRCLLKVLNLRDPLYSPIFDFFKVLGLL